MKDRSIIRCFLPPAELMIVGVIVGIIFLILAALQNVVVLNAIAILAGALVTVALVSLTVKAVSHESGRARAWFRKRKERP